MSQQHGILVVEDDDMNLQMIATRLGRENYTVFTARDGYEGWTALQAHQDKIHTILLDRKMPNMDGMTLMQKIKADPKVKNIPIIIQTAVGQEHDIVEGIKAGAYYYITKPFDKDLLLAITRAAISEYTKLDLLRMELSDLESLKQRLYLLKDASFEFQNLVDVHFLASFLSNLYPDPARVILGISELLLNAVEHGNLGITYKEKSQLLKESLWEQEIKKRLIDPQNTHKTAHVHLTKASDKITLEITDAGNGFDWQDYMEISQERATHLHGRGIALSKCLSFDMLEYLGCGNTVIATVYIHEKSG